MSLANTFITKQGGPTRAAQWLTEQTGRTYTMTRVAGFRQRGVPRNLLPLVQGWVIDQTACSDCADRLRAALG